MAELGYSVLWVIEEVETGREVARFGGNVVLDVGLQELARLFTGSGGTAYSATAAQIGVGNGSQAPDRGQTGLVGTQTAFKAMNPGYPQIGADGFTITFQSTFGPSEALFNWQEFCVSNGSVVFNRRTQNVGTKSGGSWRVNVIIRFAPAS